MTSTARTAVLVIGLDPYRVPGPWDPEPVAAAIEAGMKGLAENGFDAEACLVGLDGQDDVATRVASALRARSWQCVVVGGGIRHDEGQLELFELILNSIRRDSPDAAIAFNRTPRDIAEAVKRALALGNDPKPDTGAKRN